MRGKQKRHSSFVAGAAACASAAVGLAAAPASARPSSPPQEIAAGAVACIEALGGETANRAAIEAAGWRADRSGFVRAGSNVRIVLVPMGGGMCVVDAYGERADSFEAIAQAVQSQLTARFGREVAPAGGRGDESTFSRGQGFTIGNRISVVSSERRPDGLSIRVTAMSMPPR
ncbi:MAG TPA: hypothetical protein VF552_05700 [Allosphingosinicella sp.]|jgi:hypothetical protein